MDQIDIAQEQDHLIRKESLFMTIRMVKKSAYDMPLVNLMVCVAVWTVKM